MSLSLCSSVLSFNAPVVMRPAQRASVHMAASDMVGVSVETGGKVWDPLKLSEKMDEGNLKLMRAAELKHGRVAMLANVGWAWTATGTHFEGMISSSQKLSFAEIAAASDPIAAAAKVSVRGGAAACIHAPPGRLELYVLIELRQVLTVYISSIRVMGMVEKPVREYSVSRAHLIHLVRAGAGCRHLADDLCHRRA